MHPKEAKLALAKEIVSIYHSPAAADKECEEFERIFSKGKLPKDLPIYKVNKETIDIIEVLYDSRLVSSKNEARRLFGQGSISLVNPNNPSIVSVLGQPEIEVPKEGLIFKVGKRRFLKVICQ